MTVWIEALRRRLREEGAAVMVTIAGATGSTPRLAGTRMIVGASGVDGTIGGGNLEYRALGMAHDLLGESGSPAPRLHPFPLGPSLGQCCGGNATVLFERVAADDAESWLGVLDNLLDNGATPSVITRLDTGARLVVAGDRRHGTLGDAETDRAAASLTGPDGTESRLTDLEAVADAPLPLFVDVVRRDEAVLALFGAGHVGKSLVRVMSTLPGWRIKWVDSRADQFPDSAAASVEICLVDHPADEVADLPAGAFALVMTHSHASDFEICERLLRRDDLAFCGLIGSQTKRAQFLKRLAHRQLPPAAIARLTSPIGIAGIGGKHPAEIAIAVVAQILQVRDAAATRSANEELSA